MLTSIIRTVVPWLVALIGPWLLRTAGVGEADLSAVLSVLLGAVYYVVVRLLERVWPTAGLLLGRRGAPEYAARHLVARAFTETGAPSRHTTS